MESLVRCLWVWTDLLILISTFSGLAVMEPIIFEQHTGVHWIFSHGLCHRQRIFYFVSVLCWNLSAAVSVPAPFPASRKSGITEHHSHSLCSVRQLHNTPLAQPLLVWPCWSHTSNLEPTPKLHPPAHTLCLCFPKLVYISVWWHDKLPNHLKEAKPIVMQYFSCIHHH